jgi:hypothetical protein
MQATTKTARPTERITMLTLIALALSAAVSVENGSHPTQYAIDAGTSCIVADNGTRGQAVCVGKTAATMYTFRTGTDPLEWQTTATITGRNCAAVSTGGNVAIWYKNGHTHAATYTDDGEIHWNRHVSKNTHRAMKAAIADANSTGIRAPRFATVCR